ncbi:MAG: hypothetical protein ACXWZ6_12425, partial [Solirubrobacterales bacterium]
VADGGPGFEPVVTAGREPEPGGWGLFIVQGLADRWGTLHRDGMSRVWFEIDIRDHEIRAPGELHRRSSASEARRGGAALLEPQVETDPRYALRPYNLGLA